LRKGDIVGGLVMQVYEKMVQNPEVVGKWNIFEDK
jgi:hypothetical protein